MFIYSFKFRWLRVAAWVMLVIFILTGIYFMADTEKTLPTEESVEIWQV